jgi:hypothetical protein
MNGPHATRLGLPSFLSSINKYFVNKKLEVMNQSLKSGEPKFKSGELKKREVITRNVLTGDVMTMILDENVIDL